MSALLQSQSFEVEAAAWRTGCSSQAATWIQTIRWFATSLRIWYHTGAVVLEVVKVCVTQPIFLSHQLKKRVSVPQQLHYENMHRESWANAAVRHCQRRRAMWLKHQKTKQAFKYPKSKRDKNNMQHWHLYWQTRHTKSKTTGWRSTEKTFLFFLSFYISINPLLIRTKVS